MTDVHINTLFHNYTNATGNNFVPLSSEVHIHVQSAKVCCVENVLKVLV